MKLSFANQSRRRRRSSCSCSWNLDILSCSSVLLLSLLSLLSVSTVVEAASKPSVKVNHFASLPARVSYFDDSSALLYHDAEHGEVYRSEDEGATWDFVSGPERGKAYMVMEHPYDGKTAFILSNGKTHWRTTNRGKTWQSFDTPEPPAVRAGAPLEFHADEKHWNSIIFTGKKCTPMNPWNPWSGSLCHDEAYYTEDGFATPVKTVMEYMMHCTWAKISKDVRVKNEHLKRIYCIGFEGSTTPPSIRSRSSSIFDDPHHLLQSTPADVKIDRERTYAFDYSTSPDSSTSFNISKRAAPGGPSRLFYSDDFYKTRNLVSFDLGRDAKNFIGFGPSGKYLVTALKDISSSSGGNAGEEMALFVSMDGDSWKKAQFPHGHGLKEGAYTIVEGTTHSLVVDVVDSSASVPGWFGPKTGNLFTSDSSGTQFVKSLEGTNRNQNGIVDYEHLASVEGVALANTVLGVNDPNAGEGRGKVRSMITFDDGSTWSLIPAPSYQGTCDTSKIESCSLHLHSVTHMRNIGRVFSSAAPGFVMGVGSVGPGLKPYEECDTFLSIDAGRTWRMVEQDAHKYEFGDDGGILVLVDDESATDHISYSLSEGKKWEKLDLGVSMRAKILTTIPDSTGQKFLLIGTQTRKDAGKQGRHVAIFIDFAPMGRKKCGDKDFEKWYARAGGSQKSECLMGHKQWFRRRKPEADCYVGDKFNDPVGHEEPCPCTEFDFECDFGYTKDADGNCVSTQRESIPPGSCVGSWQKTYQGSSGYRKIPGNTCKGGPQKDAKIDKPCEQGLPQPGEVTHRTQEFPSLVFDHMYFPESSNVIAQLGDGAIWQSRDDGLSWREIHPADHEDKFLAMTMHGYDKQRAYLIPSGVRVMYSTNKGLDWLWFNAPRPANGFGIPVLDFHPTKSDWLIWTSSEDCESQASTTCHAKAWYTTDNGRNWYKVDEYVKTCSWARDAHFPADASTIICESYRDKKGDQRSFTTGGPKNNPLELIAGGAFYKGKKTKLFDSVIGFAVFEQYMVVAEYIESSASLRLQISMDARTFHEAEFPPNMQLGNKAYTVLDSVTGAVFLHVTTHSNAGQEWGTLFKSNWNGTYYGPSLEHVNRNANGYVDFEKMLKLDGVAVVNIVSNADDATISGAKQLQTRITHNDGGRWKTLDPPARDSLGSPYSCNRVGCSLHLHGYTERSDPRATYSSPSAVGLMIAVGNVGESLAPYTDSDTFLTRDGGFTWEEVKKDAHMWEFGDQGSIIVLVDDEQPTDQVLYSTDEGKTWNEYNFGVKIKATALVTVPEDTHRKFILFGAEPRSDAKSVAIYLDFSMLTTRKCKMTSGQDSDFELWSPSEERQESCLFGRQTFYNRRKRDADCYIGQALVQPQSILKNCTCTPHDFECEFNHYRDDSGACKPFPGATLLPANEEEQCSNGEDYWYERTSYRKVPFSSCEGGSRPDRGRAFVCTTSPKRHGWLWWFTIILSPFAIAALVGMWWLKKSGSRRAGSIRLPNPDSFGSSPAAQTLASIPYFLSGLLSITWGKAVELVENIPVLGDYTRRNRGSYGGYRNLSTDEDAEILRDYEEDDLEG